MFIKIVYFLVFLCFYININVLNCQQVWSPVGGNGPNHRVGAFTVYNNELVAGGLFVNDDDSRDVLKWNGSNWSSLNRTLSNNVYALHVHNSELYVGGLKSSSTNDPQGKTFFSNWDGANWTPLGQMATVSAPFNISAITSYNNDLIIAGLFSSFYSGIPMGHIAKWDGNAWVSLEEGANLSINALLVFNGELYAGGNFTSIGNVQANYIAKWDGSTWTPLGDGFNAGVYSLAEYNGELYAGGVFTTSGSTSVNRVAKWNGLDWEPLGNGMNNIVYSMVEYENELYAGGAFTLAGGSVANRVAKWDGSNWTPLGEGMNDEVWCLGIYDNNLYAGGLFTSADNQVANYVAKFEGVTNLNETSKNKLRLNAFPVPMTDEITITIETNDLSTFDNSQIEIYNTLSQVVKEIKVDEQKIKLTRNDMPNSGVYFIVLKKEGTIIETKKIVVN